MTLFDKLCLILLICFTVILYIFSLVIILYYTILSFIEHDFGIVLIGIICLACLVDIGIRHYRHRPVYIQENDESSSTLLI
jgi:hypothetical protein